MNQMYHLNRCYLDNPQKSYHEGECFQYLNIAIDNIKAAHHIRSCIAGEAYVNKVIGIATKERPAILPACRFPFRPSFFFHILSIGVENYLKFIEAFSTNNNHPEKFRHSVWRIADKYLDVSADEISLLQKLEYYAINGKYPYDNQGRPFDNSKTLTLGVDDEKIDNIIKKMHEFRKGISFAYSDQIGCCVRIDDQWIERHTVSLAEADHAMKLIKCGKHGMITLVPDWLRIYQ